MDRGEIERRLSNWAAEKTLIKKLYIFGSRARGTADSLSDLDIAIELVETDEEEDIVWIDNKGAWKKEISKIVPLEIQLELYSGETSPTIQSGLAHSSILVYEKST